MYENLETLKKLTILFVEDDVQIAEKTLQTLDFLFKNVTYAKNGIEALDIYKTNRPDIILTDIKMPLMDGIELAKIIRKDDYNTPIVFLTSFSEQKFLMDAINISSDGYLVKPINLDQMINSLCNVTRRDKYFEQEIKFLNGAYYKLPTKELFIEDKNIPLGTKEQSLMKLFISNRDRTISKEEISYNLYPLDNVTNSGIRNLVNRLKNKIGKDSILNVSGSGWRLNLI